jgi:DNA-binding NarL/FixJ family response regulator
LIRLLIAAPSPVVRTGLAALVAPVPGLELVGAFPDVSPVEDLHPDVVLATISPGDIPPPVDDSMPYYVLLGSPGPRWTREALHRGVRAILPPDALPASIIAAVEAAGSGLAVIDARDLEPLLADGLHGQPAGPPAPLTQRELEVLSLLAEGAANKTIAWKLNISENTAKFHVAAILAKLNAASRAEAVAIGLRTGLLLL